MIEIWYLNVEMITKEVFNQILSKVPLEIQNEIKRFRFDQDQKLKLLGRILVKTFHENGQYDVDWSDLEIDAQGKPFIRGGMKFNISHSGNCVVVAFSEKEVGIDLELIADLNANDLKKFMHIEEEKYINSALKKKDAFYNVWTRKEAFLKAKGIGIVDGLNNENCLNSVIEEEKSWFLHSLKFHPDYQLAVCTTIEDPKIIIIEKDYSLFQQNFN